MKRVLLSAYSEVAFSTDFQFDNDALRDIAARNSAACICALLSHFPFAAALSAAL